MTTIWLVTITGIICDHAIVASERGTASEGVVFGFYLGIYHTFPLRVDCSILVVPILVSLTKAPALL